MVHPTIWMALLLCGAQGCGARTVREEPAEQRADGPDDEPVCVDDLSPRVDDCTRASTDAVPVARIVGDGFHLAGDGEFLYFNSDHTVFRLAMSGGEPEPLTLPGGGGLEIKQVDGFVYWWDDDAVHRVPASGGEPELLVELGPQATWTVTGDAIVHAGPYTASSAVHRTSWATGETIEILPEDPEQPIWDLGVGEGRVFVSRSQSLVSVPVGGGEPQLLYDGGTDGGQPPIAHDGQVYFAGIFPENDAFAVGLLRVDLDAPSAPEVFLRGYGVAFAIDDDALFAHIIPPGSSAATTRGELLRAPLAGGEAELLTHTSAKGHLGFEISSNGLVVSDCHVYFVDRCADGVPNEFRLVAIEKPTAE